MEFRVLHFDYDSRGKPIVPGADQKHGVVKQHGPWWSVAKPPVDRRLPLLCYLWEEAPGLFGVHSELVDWAVIDPGVQRVPLIDYFDDSDDWLTCRFEGTDLVSVRSPLLVPETVVDPFTIVSWEVGVGDELTSGQAVLTLQRNSTVRTITCLDDCRLIHKVKDVGQAVVCGNAVGVMQRHERQQVSHRRIKLTKKPDKMPTPQKPLELGEAVVTNLYPSIHSTIGIGDRIAEAEA